MNWMKQRIIQYCSPSIEDLLGYHQEEIIGRSISDFLDAVKTQFRLSRIYRRLCSVRLHLMSIAFGVSQEKFVGFGFTAIL